MRISKIEVRYIEIPLEGVLRPTWAPGMQVNKHKILFLRVKTDEGISGVAATTAYAGQAAAINVNELVTPYLIGKDPFALEENTRILRIAHQRGIYAWLVENALWDIIGKTCGQPIYKLLGGSKKKVRAYACWGEIRDPATRCDNLEALKEEGFTALKVRIHAEKIDEDIALVENVRNIVGNEFHIICDANQATTWPSIKPGIRWDYARAVRTANKLEELGVVWLEEPLSKFDYKGLSRLCEDVVLPIAGGETNKGIHEIGALIENHCYDIVQVDPTFSEGLLQLKKMQGMAEYYNITFQPHSWTNGVGFGYSLHLCSAADATYIEYPYDPPALGIESFFALLKEPLRIDSSGYIELSERPGLGFEINDEAVERYTLMLIE